jgi:DNA-binding PadR family transcriptional regulator
MKSLKDKALSDLEAASLASIKRRGHATAYEVATEFAMSPADYWSGSAGAVYPLVARLLKRGLINAQPGGTGKRSSTLYALTELGDKMLLEWLLDAKRASGMGFDPLRTRLANLDLMPEDQRALFLAEVEACTQALASPPAFAGNERAQVLHESWLENRLHWLRLIHERLIKASA